MFIGVRTGAAGIIEDSARGGDPRGATAEAGEKTYGLMADWISKVIKSQFAL